MTDERFEQIGRYRVVGVLGEGAMGVVYQARDMVLDRPVAVKVMTDKIAREPDLRERFLREARAAGALQHPNVVTIYDFGEADGLLYIAMELVPGIDLSTVLAQGVPLPLDTKLAVVVGMLTGLGYAHKRGVVHRDVKPGNVRVTEEGAVKIMDFGIAHVASSQLTRTGMTMGTPSYMAPEQVTGEQVTAATDIFAAGVVLYELLAGTKPFDGPTLHSILYKIMSEAPADVFTGVAGIPASLPPIVFRALAKAPADRYADALTMVHDLERVRAGLSQHAGTTGMVAAVAYATALLATPRANRDGAAGAAVGVLSFPPSSGPGSLGSGSFGVPFDARSFPPGSFPGYFPPIPLGPTASSGRDTPADASHRAPPERAASAGASDRPIPDRGAPTGRSRTLAAAGTALVLAAGAALWVSQRHERATTPAPSSVTAASVSGAGVAAGPSATSPVAPSTTPSAATPSVSDSIASRARSLEAPDSARRSPTRRTPDVAPSSARARPAAAASAPPRTAARAAPADSHPPVPMAPGRPTPSPPASVTSPLVAPPPVAPASTTSTSVAPAPITTPPAASPGAVAGTGSVVPTPAAPSASGVRDALDAYARALESRDLGAVRRVYPAITDRQESGWRALFDATRSLDVTLTVSDVQVSGTMATASVAGTSAFVMRDGHRQTQPLTFRATLHHDGTAWRLVSVQ